MVGVVFHHHYPRLLVVALLRTGHSLSPFPFTLLISFRGIYKFCPGFLFLENRRLAFSKVYRSGTTFPLRRGVFSVAFAGAADAPRFCRARSAARPLLAWMILVCRVFFPPH
jgi:hypothetical protein